MMMMREEDDAETVSIAMPGEISTTGGVLAGRIADPRYTYCGLCGTKHIKKDWVQFHLADDRLCKLAEDKASVEVKKGSWVCHAGWLALVENAPLPSLHGARIVEQQPSQPQPPQPSSPLPQRVLRTRTPSTSPSIAIAHRHSNSKTTSPQQQQQQQQQRKPTPYINDETTDTESEDNDEEEAITPPSPKRTKTLLPLSPRPLQMIEMRDSGSMTEPQVPHGAADWTETVAQLVQSRLTGRLESVVTSKLDAILLPSQTAAKEEATGRSLVTAAMDRTANDHMRLIDMMGQLLQFQQRELTEHGLQEAQRELPVAVDLLTEAADSLRRQAEEAKRMEQIAGKLQACRDRFLTLQKAFSTTKHTSP